MTNNTLWVLTILLLASAAVQHVDGGKPDSGVEDEYRTKIILPPDAGDEWTDLESTVWDDWDCTTQGGCGGQADDDGDAGGYDDDADYHADDDAPQAPGDYDDDDYHYPLPPHYPMPRPPHYPFPPYPPPMCMPVYTSSDDCDCECSCCGLQPFPPFPPPPRKPTYSYYDSGNSGSYYRSKAMMMSGSGSRRLRNKKQGQGDEKAIIVHQEMEGSEHQQQGNRRLPNFGGPVCHCDCDCPSPPSSPSRSKGMMMGSYSYYS